MKSTTVMRARYLWLRSRSEPQRSVFVAQGARTPLPQRTRIAEGDEAELGLLRHPRRVYDLAAMRLLQRHRAARKARHEEGCA